MMVNLNDITSEYGVCLEHRGVTKFSMKEILTKGPKAIPADARSGSILSTINFSFSTTDDFYAGDTG